MKAASKVWVRGLSALVLVLGLSAFVQAADKAVVTGTWTWTQAGRNGGAEVKSTLKLKQDGDKVTGTLMRGGNNASEIEVKDGKVKDNEVTFSTTVERNGNDITTKYTGKVEGDTMNLKIEAPGRNGQAGRPREVKATREKSAA